MNKLIKKHGGCIICAEHCKIQLKDTESLKKMEVCT